MSQNFDICPSFDFILKKGEDFYNVFMIIFLDFIK